MGNLSYFYEFLNIYNPFIKDLLGGVCLLLRPAVGGEKKSKVRIQYPLSLITLQTRMQLNF